jgi:hypothetical protein
MLREHEGGIHSHLHPLVWLGHGIVYDARGYTEENRLDRRAALEAKKAPRPLETPRRSDGYEAEVSQGEPLTYVSFSLCWHLREVDVEHIRDASSQ